MANTNWPKGFMVQPRPDSIPSVLLNEWRNVPSAHASDCLGRLNGAIGLRAYHGDLDLPLCGMAITVRVRPGDNLMIHKAMLMAQPGDVIVVDGAGDLTQAVVGGLMRTTALARRLGGLVINGVIRDINEWSQGDIPIFALGHAHRGPSKVGPGEVNVPVACANMVVAAGDLVLGDADGVVTIPRHRIAELLPSVKDHAQHEAQIRQKNLEQGGDEERFDKLLRALGCPV